MENCQNGERCLTHTLWNKLGSEIYTFLEGITLAGFLKRDKVGKVIRRQQQVVDLPANGLRKTVA
jgi:Rrf2 family iron-sulfur cluster assembly transcriptional regulator